MERAMKFFRHISLKQTPSHLLSIAILSSTFFVGNVIAADNSSTLLQDISSLLRGGVSTPSKDLANTTCPLNSGGTSLLGTIWRLDSIYGNKIPEKLKIDMTVNQHALTGNGGCNKYTAKFKQVGSTDFSVKKITKTRKACVVIIPHKAAPTINVGSWEGSYIRTLKRMKSVRQINNNTLQFFNRNGDIAMVFYKINDEKMKQATREKETVVAKVN